MEKKTIWIIESGDYSDYSVDAFFSTEELADHYLKLRGDDGWYDIPFKREVALDVPMYDRPTFLVRIFTSNNYVYAQQLIEKDEHPFSEWVVSWERGINPKDNTKLIEFSYNLIVEASDEKHAEKVASEQFAMVLADYRVLPLSKWDRGLETPAGSACYSRETRTFELLDEQPT